MLKSILEVRTQSAINSLCVKEKDLNQYQLNSDDWTLLTKIHKLLKPFEYATRQLEGRASTISQTLPFIDFLLEKYEQAVKDLVGERDDESIFLRTSLYAGWKKLEKYYGISDRSPAYISSVVLDPVHKWEYFEEKWNPDWLDTA